MTRGFRVGTRRSHLARIQTRLAVRRLARTHPETAFREVELETSGDRDSRVGGSTDFTDAIDRAVLAGELDVGVHSAKDLPARLDPGLTLVGCLPRADPRDSLVLAPGLRGGPLPRGARVGSSSPRRRAQLYRWRRDLDVVEIRGNVDRRLELVRTGEVDAAILAVAGLVRLRRSPRIDRVLPLTRFLSAPGQGAIALVARAGDRDAIRVFASVDHPRTTAAVTAERSFAEGLGGDCTVPLGAHATVARGQLHLAGEVLSEDGSASVRARRSGPTDGAMALGARLADDLLRRGAAELVGDPGR